ncbi:MAG: glycosyltransferase family 2 protein [Acidobacteria bacterium]|nr:glycosyltransferase family 2 protein [Acidobacteriota bacterium]
MRISVIIVTYNRKDDLRRTLRSVQRQMGVEFEVIVADNGSSDGTVEMIRSSYPRVRVIAMGANTGMRAHNQAVREAQADFVFILDNDMVLVEDYVLARASAYLTSNPRLGAVACRVWDVDRTRGGAALRLSGNSPKHIDSGRADAGFDTSAFDGGAAAFRKSALLESGLFCEEFFLYHGEVDLSTRLLDRGWLVRYFPQISVIHCRSAVQRSSRLHSYLATRNFFWYLYRNYPAVDLVPEAARFLVQSARAVLTGQRRPIPWLEGVAAGLLSPWRARGRMPARRETIRRQQEIRVADRVRKNLSGEMDSLRPLTTEEIQKFGL